MIIRNSYDSSFLKRIPTTSHAEMLEFLRNGPEKISSLDRGLLESISRTLESRTEKLSRTLASETGNPLSYCREEIRAASNLVLNSETIRSINSLSTVHDLSGGFSSTDEFRGGSPAIIINSSINPLYRFVESVLASLFSQTPVVLKPSVRGSYTIHQLWKEISGDLDQVKVAFIPHRSREFRTLLMRSDPIRILFSGGLQALGSISRVASPGRITPSLNVSSHAIVWSDTDLDHAAKSVVSLALGGIRDTAFQPRRILVESSVYDYFVNRVVEEASRMRWGDPEMASTDVPSLISRQAVKEFFNAVYDESGRWNRVLSEPKIEENSSSPVIVGEEGNPGRLWNDLKYGPFLAIKPVEGISKLTGAISSFGSGSSVIVFSTDWSLISHIYRNSPGSLTIVNPPSHLSYRDIFSIQGNLTRQVELLSQKRRLIHWR